MVSRPPPAFKALIVHRDPVHKYSLFVPDDWHRLELESDGGQGAIYAPDLANIATSFSAEGRDLGTEVRPKDLSALRGGMLSGLRSLPGCTIESVEAEVVGQLLTMEARLTHTADDGSTRKRWVRLLYQGHTQVRLIAQAVSVEEFEYWEPVFFQAMRSVRFGDWWGEVTGLDWAATAFPSADESDASA